MQLQRTDRYVVEDTVQREEGAFAQLCSILADGGKRRGAVLAEGDIIESHNGDILRNLKSHLLTCLHYGVSQQIVAAGDGGASLLQKIRKMKGENFSSQVCVPGQILRWQSEYLHSLVICCVAFLVYIVAKSTA